MMRTTTSALWLWSEVLLGMFLRDEEVTAPCSLPVQRVLSHQTCSVKTSQVGLKTSNRICPKSLEQQARCSQVLHYTRIWGLVSCALHSAGCGVFVSIQFAYCCSLIAVESSLLQQFSLSKEHWMMRLGSCKRPVKDPSLLPLGAGSLTSDWSFKQH